MAVSAMVCCSPVASSMSISRSLGSGMISLASLIRLIRHAAHGGDDDDDLVALRAVLGHARRDVFDAVGVAHRGAAEFLDDQSHVLNFGTRKNARNTTDNQAA